MRRRKRGALLVVLLTCALLLVVQAVCLGTATAASVADGESGAADDRVACSLSATSTECDALPGCPELSDEMSQATCHFVDDARASTSCSAESTCRRAERCGRGAALEAAWLPLRLESSSAAAAATELQRFLPLHNIEASRATLIALMACRCGEAGNQCVGADSHTHHTTRRRTDLKAARPWQPPHTYVLVCGYVTSRRVVSGSHGVMALMA